MQVPTALVVECLTVLQRFCFCSFFLLLPVNEQVARKAARRERQRGRAATSAAASRMFTDQSQRCLAQGAAFVENARSKFMIDSVNLLVTKIRIQTPDKQKNPYLEDKNSGCILRQLRATATQVGLYISKH